MDEEVNMLLSTDFDPLCDLEIVDRELQADTDAVERESYVYDEEDMRMPMEQVEDSVKFGGLSVQCTRVNCVFSVRVHESMTEYIWHVGLVQSVDLMDHRVQMSNETGSLDMVLDSGVDVLRRGLVDAANESQDPQHLPFYSAASYFTLGPGYVAPSLRRVSASSGAHIDIGAQPSLAENGGENYLFCELQHNISSQLHVVAVRTTPCTYVGALPVYDPGRGDMIAVLGSASHATSLRIEAASPGQGPIRIIHNDARISPYSITPLLESALFPPSSSFNLTTTVVRVQEAHTQVVRPPVTINEDVINMLPSSTLKAMVKSRISQPDIEVRHSMGGNIFF